MLAKFYITTPLYYLNGNPHIGHASATIAADVISRWHRMRGDDVFFVTGSDEHGEKNQKAAEQLKKDPQAYVDGLVETWKKAWGSLDISYDDFIRTSEKRHEAAVPDFLARLKKAGDIYKGFYEGWYCVHDETFITDTQLRDGKCPECGRAVTRVKEESYFFKLGRYQDLLLGLYAKNPSFLSPSYRADEVKNRVRGGLKDLSITRPSLVWGIPFPGDSKHTVYVWVEALLGYMTVLGWPGKGRFGEFWPADVHLVGKEINWFHTVIWPAMLMSADIPIPRKVFAHGWWTVDGKKMSKSVGNVIDPIKISKAYGVDAFRYFLIREKPLGEDGDFSEAALKARINGELVADLGNLVYRVLSLAERFDGNIEGTPELDKHLDIKRIDALMLELDLFGALNEIWAFVREANRYVNEKEPWKLQGDALGNVLYNLLEACRVISIMIGPFMPSTSAKMRSQLGVGQGYLKDCRFGKFDGKPKKGSYLFTKIEN
ncbi:MAG: methionine--tRNA ligase [Candidatus Micrarchaeota archaeon]|nr:methionine--tRNA ligase [Candidatus Micrarchaeota archaeon]